MLSVAKNNTFKILLFIATLFLVLSCSSLVVNAAERNDSTNSEIQPQGELGLPMDTGYSLPTEDGGTIFFESEKDYQTYLDNNINAKCATCNQTTQTTLEKYTVPRVFISYHPATPGWDKISSVSISAGINYGISGTFTNDGSTFGITFSQSFTTTKNYTSQYPNKFIRVGVYKDILYHKVKNVVKNPAGTIIDTYTTKTATPVGETYTQLEYKD